MNTGRRWAGDIADIKRRYRAGESAYTLAARYKTTPANMWKVFGRYGIKARSPKEAAAMRERMGRGVGNRRKAA